MSVCNDAALLTLDRMLYTPNISGVRDDMILGEYAAGPGLISTSPADSNNMATSMPYGELVDLGLNGAQPGGVSTARQHSCMKDLKKH